VLRPFEVLVVCTANVCRSPLAEHIIATRIAYAVAHQTIPERVIDVTSAGDHAEVGQPMCPQSAALLGEPAHEHHSRPITTALLENSDLVLGADRGNRGECARLLPACRPHLFTLRQAAELAQTVVTELANHKLPDSAPPLPDHPSDRLRWLVTEMDAARGSRAGEPEGSDDITDNHGNIDHLPTLKQVEAASTALADAFIAVLNAPIDVDGDESPYGEGHAEHEPLKY